jgi:nucleotide-binding universal stress UspA family protein
MQSANHILCLVSDDISAALTQAVHLACRTEATLHAMPVGSATRETVETLLQSVDRPPDSPPLQSCVAPALSAPDTLVDTLQAYTSDTGIDLVVIDTPHDRGPIPPLATALTQELVSALDCSVFVVEHNADPASFQRILVPTDLSDPELTTLRYATGLASVYDATVDLLHVIETVPYIALTPIDRLSLSSTSFPEHRARHRLSSLVQKSPVGSTAFHAHFEYGDPADQIGRFVNQHAVDLLVLSPKSTSSPRSLGPVADRVLRRVACPVVLVRPSDAPPHSGDSPTPFLTETTE